MAKERDPLWYKKLEAARIAQLDRYLHGKIRRRKQQTTWENKGRTFWRDPSIEPTCDTY